MAIVNALGKDPAPLGAAGRVPVADCSHMPLLAELEPSLALRGSYRQVAPNGAFARVLPCERSGLKAGLQTYSGSLQRSFSNRLSEHYFKLPRPGLIGEANPEQSVLG